MFDPIINSKLNQLLEGGGYSEQNRANIPSKPSTIVSVEALGKEYACISKLTPTKEEFYDDGIIATFGNITGNINSVFSVYSSTDDALVLLAGASGTFVFVAYSLEISLEGLTVKFPTTGIYVDTVFVDDLGGSGYFLWKTIHPIDPKYLPGVCLPVVELSTAFENGASYTEGENAKLKAAWEIETPVVIKCQITIGSQSYKPSCAVWNTVVVEGDVTVYTFLCGAGSNMLQIYSVDSGKTWGCLVN